MGALRRRPRARRGLHMLKQLSDSRSNTSAIFVVSEEEEVAGSARTHTHAAIFANLSIRCAWRCRCWGVVCLSCLSDKAELAIEGER
mmetsp:Transcript_30026/g.49722  ORF Transcript_30026/g.49722 Transcript_30026/m.49722 type:complete len:87 (-) Transcript_30026:219-479(-)